MHAQDVIHGDLTTSNLMIREATESLVHVYDAGLKCHANSSLSGID